MPSNVDTYHDIYQKPNERQDRKAGFTGCAGFSLKALAPGLTARAVLEKFASMRKSIGAERAGSEHQEANQVGWRQSEPGLNKFNPFFVPVCAGLYRAFSPAIQTRYG